MCIVLKHPSSDPLPQSCFLTCRVKTPSFTFGVGSVTDAGPRAPVISPLPSGSQPPAPPGTTPPSAQPFLFGGTAGGTASVPPPPLNNFTAGVRSAESAARKDRCYVYFFGSTTCVPPSAPRGTTMRSAATSHALFGSQPRTGRTRSGFLCARKQREPAKHRKVWRLPWAEQSGAERCRAVCREQCAVHYSSRNP